MKGDERKKEKPARKIGARRARSSKLTSRRRISPSRASSFSIQPEGVSLTRMLETLKPHDHLCLIYESPEEWRACVVPFIAMGLKRGEKCIYVVDTSTADEIRKYLAEEGVDVAYFEKSGQLSILSETEAYTKGGSFDPDRMIVLLASETEKAIAEGYTALRITGEMTWVLRGHHGSERLLEYEAKLNRDFFPKYPCVAICQYDRWKFDPEIIKGVIMTHPLLVRGNNVYRNFYYIPTDEFLNAKRAELEAQHWLNNVEREQRITETLRQSEEKFSKAFGANPLPMCLTTMPEGLFIDVNEAFLHVTGHSRQDVIGHTTAELGFWVEPDVRDRLMEMLLSKGRVSDIECKFRMKSGEVRLGLDSVEIINAGGQQLLLSIINDITDLKHAEEAARMVSERFERLVSTSPVVIYACKLEGDWPPTFISENILTQWGYTMQEFLKPSFWLEHIHPEDKDRIFTEVPKVLEDGYHSHEYRFLFADGTYHWIHDELRLICDAQGKPLECVGSCLDITERKRVEEELKRSEQKYHSLVEDTSVGVAAADLAGNLTFVNSAVCQLLGYAENELVGKPFADFLHPDSIEAVLPVFLGASADPREKVDLEFRAVGKKGGVVDLWASVTRMKEGNQTAGFNAILIDIAQRKRVEAEKQELEQKTQIASRLASVGEMAAGIAHEINNPMTSVIGYAQLLSGREDIPEDIRMDLKVIDEGAQRVAGIIKRLLTFARQSRPERTLVSINDLITNTLDLRAYHQRTNNIKVIAKLATDLPLTTADPAQLQQVFLNIVVNAEAAMEQARGGSKLLVKTEEVNGNIRVSFKDNGPGITRKNLARVFDPFFTTREVGRGTGLGLSICHGVIAEHGGRIWVESEPGRGATFIVELPIVTGPIQLEMAEPAGKKPRKVPKAKILVVDDEPSTLDFLSRLLTDEGHEVDTVSNAAGALEMVKNKRYSLILLDIKVPGASGIELYGRMQKIALSLAERVIFVTGDVLGTDTEAFLSKTKAPYITKPFDVNQLKKKTERFLSGDQ